MDLQVKVAEHLWNAADGDADLRRYQEAMEGLKKVVDILGNRLLTRSMLVLCQALASVLRLRSETDTWSTERAMALMPLEHEISSFYGSRPIGSLLADRGPLAMQISALHDLIFEQLRELELGDEREWYMDLLESVQDVSSVLLLRTNP